MEAVLVLSVLLSLAAVPKTISLPVYCDVRVTNKLTSNFDKSWRVMVGTSGSLYDALNNIQTNDSSFSFASERYDNFGQYVISICHMTACSASREYWEILKGEFGEAGKPTANGASKIYPQTGDVFVFNLTTYKAD